MNREIKFREWDNNKMNYNPVWYNCYNEFEINEDIKSYKVMQYTGLKDKNGKDIYEGDIVMGLGRIGEILFGDGKFYAEPQDKSMRGLLSCDMNDGEIEVIGNIYENPELLDTKPKDNASK